MKKVLLLGAGMVAKPLVDYLLNHQIQLTIATRTVEKALKLINGHGNAKAVSWTVDDMQALSLLIADHDLVVSLLPYTYHVAVAKLCVKHQKNMLTTSYVSEKMKALDKAAKEAGIILLNEMGVDPGFDHMTAMRIIDKVRAEGGKVKGFYSLCGALAAPEEADNPFHYKFTWSPRGVIMAGNNSAKYLRNGTIVEVSSNDLFKQPLKIDFPEVGEMEVYSNRDSLSYIDIYGLKNIETMYRGTFRYKNWCEIMDALKILGMLSYDRKSFDGKTYKKAMARELDVYPANMKEKVAERLNLSINSPAIVAMEWLGLFSDDLVKINEGSPFDLTTDRMLKKMMLPQGARDMVIMLHAFLVENADGSRQVIKSRLLDFATAEDTSIARTVGLPAGIAAKMILEGKFSETGVHIPISKTIYEPVLDELQKLGITMKEEWGLPENEML
ncbi:saccharopine dehydrogenase NADP-binding domain-containing protein [Maribellus sp. CM-23]|uniref:saccharopine dehydrogenase C-terminal domain-containing protein n=1 Tax=Maribellus sp. CM-23 TaxID=2781026 RepID=UPI001F3C0EB1|nr:saccharopine dehydrogenase C-terminal domain-containing protein [Maribellus sp. CM-23]MCE4563029.1 saccharopine dehydrogenase NADP-binding domain-containing protein [Maribellus sp. CM-23]